MKTFRMLAVAVALAVAGQGLTAGEVRPKDDPPPNVTPPKPPQPPVVTPPPVTNPPSTNPPLANPPATPPNGAQPRPPVPNPNNPVNELNMLLTELLNGDATKRDAAGKALVGKGAMAYHRLTALLTNADADVVKRTKDIRAQIEQRGMQLVQDANAIQEKMQQAPLTAAGIDEVRKAWMAVFTFAPQNEMRQYAAQAVQSTQQMVKDLEAATKALAENDKALAAKPPPAPLPLAALFMTRTQIFQSMQRFDDALKAARDGYEAGGKESRFASSALKTQAELLMRKQDASNTETVCKKILAEYADSLEARFAYMTLVDLHAEHKRWDEAVETAKNFMNACPVDEEAQEKIDSLLDHLMDAERDYTRAYGIAGWLKGKLPVSRLRKETLQVLAKCSEYAVKDLAKAEAAYKALGANYADEVHTEEVDAQIKRVKAKAEGKFPKEPAANDEGPAGALAKFLAAVRAKDGKLLAAAVPELEAKDAPDKLTAEDSELVSGVTFSDYVVKNVKVDGDKAELSIDRYEWDGEAPQAIVQHAFKENSGWKISWTDPDEQTQPAAKTPAAPKAPGEAPEKPK